MNPNQFSNYKPPTGAYSFKPQPNIGNIPHPLAMIQADLPKTYGGTPILDFFKIKPAYASESGSGQVQGAQTGPGGAFPIAGGNQGSTQSPSTPSQPTVTSNNGLDPHINPATGVWDDNYYQQQLKSSPDYISQTQNAINSGYDSYFSQLDSILNQGLPSQRAAQEDIARSQYQQGVNQLDLQKSQGLADLSKQREQTSQQQSKTLKDIGSNLQNSFLAGNVYLGARGAGDSSAANQYSYALTKLGAQQRGDVNAQFANIQNDISGRETRLNEIYDSETRNLQFETEQKISSIASWFGEQQNAIKLAQAQGQLAKGQDLADLSRDALNVAIQNLQNVQAEAANRRTALDQWAMNNSQNIQQLKSNMMQINQAPFAAAPTAQAIAGTPQIDQSGNLFTRAPIGLGSSDDRTDLFGRPIA